jgi:hypothetical protein
MDPWVGREKEAVSCSLGASFSSFHLDAQVDSWQVFGPVICERLG